MATTERYTLSLHAALPISHKTHTHTHTHTQLSQVNNNTALLILERDRKSTRLNCSHTCISYSVLCFLMIWRPQRDTLSPYTPLFRSHTKHTHTHTHTHS